MVLLSVQRQRRAGALAREVDPQRLRIVLRAHNEAVRKLANCIRQGRNVHLSRLANVQMERLALNDEALLGGVFEGEVEGRGELSAVAEFERLDVDGAAGLEDGGVGGALGDRRRVRLRSGVAGLLLLRTRAAGRARERRHKQRAELVAAVGNEEARGVLLGSGRSKALATARREDGLELAVNVWVGGRRLCLDGHHLRAADDAEEELRAVGVYVVAAEVHREVNGGAGLDDPPRVLLPRVLLGRGGGGGCSSGGRGRSLRALLGLLRRNFLDGNLLHNRRENFEEALRLYDSALRRANKALQRLRRGKVERRGLLRSGAAAGWGGGRRRRESNGASTGRARGNERNVREARGL